MEKDLASNVKALTVKREDTAAKLSDYLQFKAALECLGPEISTKVNLGCEFFVQAKGKVNKIMVKAPIGDIYIEMTKDEAI